MKRKTMKKIVTTVALLFISCTVFSQEIKDSTNLITNEKLFEFIKVIPNPTSEILFVRNGDEVTSYQLFNMDGEKVQESKNNIQIISLIDEKVGNYFLILEIKGNYKTYRVQKY